MQKANQMNKSILDALKKYSAISDPGYAVLIKGKWGSGKTYFIKEKILPLLKQEKFENILSISLYGVSDLSEIRKRILRAAIPLQKQTTAAFKLLEPLAKKLNNFIKVDAEIIVDLMDMGNTVLIVDDLERCKMPPPETLGYLNDFIEEKKFHVIIVANEDEIKDPDYLENKEKTIGREFILAVEFELAYEDFVSKIPGMKTFYGNHKNEVRQLFSASEKNNLRILKHALWAYKEIYDVLDKELKEKTDIPGYLLYYFFCYFSIARETDLSIDELKDFNRLRLGRDQSVPKLRSYFAPYTVILNFYDSIFDEQTWVDITQGRINAEVINSRLRARYQPKASQPAWLQLRNETSITDHDEFLTLIKHIEAQLDGEEPIHTEEEFLHIVSALLHFSQHIPGFTVTDLEKRAETRIKQYLETGQLAKLGLTPSGFGPKQEQNKTFQEIKKALHEAKLEAKKRTLKDSGQQLFELMSTDPQAFSKKLHNTFDRIGEFSHVPILNELPPEEFVTSWLNLNNEQMNQACDFFNYRNSPDEAEWRNKVKNLLKRRHRNFKNDIKYISISRLIYRLEHPPV